MSPFLFCPSRPSLSLCKTLLALRCAEDAFLVASHHGLALPVLAGAADRQEGCRHTGSPADFSAANPQMAQHSPLYRSSTTGQIDATAEKVSAGTVQHQQLSTPDQQLLSRALQHTVPQLEEGVSTAPERTVGTPGRVQSERRPLLYFQLEGRPETRALVALDALPKTSAAVGLTIAHLIRAVPFQSPGCTRDNYTSSSLCHI